MRILLILMALLLAACPKSNNDDNPPTERPTSGKEKPKEDDALKVDPKEETDEDEEAANKAKFPAMDKSCTADDECELSSAGWRGDYCCSQCGASAYSKAWLGKVKEVCDAAMKEKDYHQRCPHLSCTQPPEKIAKCVEGTCTAELKDVK